MIELLTGTVKDLIPAALLNKKPSKINSIGNEVEVNRIKLSNNHVEKMKAFIKTLDLKTMSYAQMHARMKVNKLAYRENGSMLSVQYVKGIAQEIIKESGIPRERRIRIYKDSKIEKITKLLNDGLGIKEVSEIVGAHDKYVYRIKKQLEDQKKIGDIKKYDEAKNER